MRTAFVLFVVIVIAVVIVTVVTWENPAVVQAKQEAENIVVHGSYESIRSWESQRIIKSGLVNVWEVILLDRDSGKETVLTISVDHPNLRVFKELGKGRMVSFRFDNSLETSLPDYESSYLIPVPK